MGVTRQDSINEVQEQIGALKEGLVVERKKRYNKEIYEEACKDINKYPPHKATKVWKSSAETRTKKQGEPPLCALELQKSRAAQRTTRGK